MAKVKPKPSRSIKASVKAPAGHVQSVQTTGPSDEDMRDFGPEGIPGPGDMPESPDTEAAEERAEEMAHQGDEGFHVVGGLDGITQAVCQHYGHAFLPYTEDFTRQDFPLDRKGWPVRMKRLYHVVNLCLDVVPAEMTDTEIQERKATIEALGYNYTYWRENEPELEPDQVRTVLFGTRLKPAPKKYAKPGVQPKAAQLHGADCAIFA